MQIVSSIGPSFIDDVFDSVEIATPARPDLSGAYFSTRLYKIDLPSAVVVAATESWDKIREFFTQVARDGWDSVKAHFDELMIFINEQLRVLGNLAEDYEQMILEKLHEMISNASEFLLKSVRPQVEVGNQVFILSAINVETKLLFSASIEASVTTIGKFIGSGEATVKATYSRVADDGK
ncbi:MAG: hypothetical protein AAF558_03030 [Verrucomicrobiota bacterium]